MMMVLDYFDISIEKENAHKKSKKVLRFAIDNVIS